MLQDDGQTPRRDQQNNDAIQLRPEQVGWDPILNQPANAGGPAESSGGRFAKGSPKRSQTAILSEYTEEQQQIIPRKLDRLSVRAQFVAQDFSLQARLNEKDGDHCWDPNTNLFYLNVEEVLEKPLDYLRMVVCHEGGHRAITCPDRIPYEFAAQLGFPLIHNFVEDPRVDNFVSYGVKEFREQNRIFCESNLAVGKEKLRLLSEQGGFSRDPRYLEAGFQILRISNQKKLGFPVEIDKEIRPEVRAAVKKVLPHLDEIWESYPDWKEVKNREIVEHYADYTHHILITKIWPHIQPLITEDIREGKAQDLLNELANRMQDQQSAQPEGQEEDSLLDHVPQEIRDLIEEALNRGIEPEQVASELLDEHRDSGGNADGPTNRSQAQGSSDENGSSGDPGSQPGDIPGEQFGDQPDHQEKQGGEAISNDGIEGLAQQEDGDINAQEKGASNYERAPQTAPDEERRPELDKQLQPRGDAQGESKNSGRKPSSESIIDALNDLIDHRGMTEVNARIIDKLAELNNEVECALDKKFESQFGAFEDAEGASDGIEANDFAEAQKESDKRVSEQRKRQRATFESYDVDPRGIFKPVTVNNFGQYETDRREIVHLKREILLPLSRKLAQAGEPKIQTGLPEGDDIDLDIYIDERLRGIPPWESEAWHEQLYSASSVQPLTLLIDLSTSMSGRRVEQARKIATLLTETLTPLGTPHEIVGFNSELFLLKAHNQSLNDEIKGRIGAMGELIQPGTSTGWALSHVSERLLDQGGHKQKIWLFTDGAPTPRGIHANQEWEVSAVEERILSTKRQQIEEWRIATSTQRAQRGMLGIHQIINTEEMVEIMKNRIWMHHDGKA